MENRNCYAAVRQALRDICTEQAEKDSAVGIKGLFKHFASASHVAMRAGCSTTTARKHLERLAHCRGYSRSRIWGTYGYNWDGQS